MSYREYFKKLKDENPTEYKKQKKIQCEKYIPKKSKVENPVSENIFTKAYCEEKNIIIISHPNKKVEYIKNWKLNNPEKVSATQKKYYRKNNPKKFINNFCDCCEKLFDDSYKYKRHLESKIHIVKLMNQLPFSE